MQALVLERKNELSLEELDDVVNERTDGWGADIVFECSGNERAAAGVFAPLCPGGVVVFVGMPPTSVKAQIELN